MHRNMYGTGVLPVREQLPGQKAEREEPSSRASTNMTIGGRPRFQSMYLSHGWATGPHPPPPAIRLPLPFAARRARHSATCGRLAPRASAGRAPQNCRLRPQGPQASSWTPSTPPLLHGAARHGGGRSAPATRRNRRARAARSRLAAAVPPCPARRRAHCCPACVSFASTCGGGLVLRLPTPPSP